MWLLVFIGTFVCLSVSGDAGIGVVSRKCCWKSQSLVNVSDFNVTSEIYECLTREEMEEKYNVSNSPLKIGDNVSVDYGMPKFCDGLEIYQLSPEKLDPYPRNENESCYVRLVVAEVVNGSSQPNISRVVTLTCFRNEIEKTTETNLTIEQMRKCCPKGQSYDTKNHVCRVTDENITEEWVIENIQKNVTSDFIYEVESGLHCENNEIEVSEKLFDLDLQGSNLNAFRKNGTDGGVASRGEWCLDREYGKPGLVARVCAKNCSSYGAYCLRKCCPIGKHYKGCSSQNKQCVRNEDEILFDPSAYINGLEKRVNTEVLGIKTEILVCPSGNTMESNDHHLTPEGTLNSHFGDNLNYCFEILDSRNCPKGNTTFKTHICFIGDDDDTIDNTSKFRIKAVLNTISCVCLVMTLIVYVSKPELRNLHGKMLICHASMMLVAFSCLARAQYNGVENDTLCTALGYCIYFGFTAAFAWLNVMCVDIWSTLTSMEKRDDEWKRFIWYSLYAWSLALLLTVTVFLLDWFPVANFLDANIGVKKCWFGRVNKTETDWPHYIFFVTPMGLITCTNFVLFLLTARHCALVKSEVHDHLAKYLITAKLWVIMGAGWVAELLSTLFSKPECLWTVIDHVNELQGVFIFLVLICKPKLYYQIRKWLKLEVVTLSREPMTFSTKPSGSKSSNRQTEDEAQSKRDAIKEA